MTRGECRGRRIYSSDVARCMYVLRAAFRLSGIGQPTCSRSARLAQRYSCVSSAAGVLRACSGFFLSRPCRRAVVREDCQRAGRTAQRRGSWAW
ncbi:hypothetical protein B0H12DRAFT_1152967 [Mycena haematopus]|nr:hypothetical protein B0H12DRAFT_1152967 [Mycena haematopus]